MGISDADKFEAALLAMDRRAARRILLAQAEQTGPFGAIDAVMTVALQRIGEAWERGERALSQIYMAGKICEELVPDLLPDSDSDRLQSPRLAVAVFEDRHVLGKRMLVSALAASGFRMADLGSVEAGFLLDYLRQHDVEVLMLSTLMLASALHLETFCNELAKWTKRPRVIVGGAPFRLDERLWREVGADAMGFSAADAPGLVSGSLPAAFRTGGRQ